MKSAILLLLAGLLLAAVHSSATNNVHSQFDNKNCTINRVSNISDPGRDTDHLVETCGDKVTTTPIDKHLASRYEAGGSEGQSNFLNGIIQLLTLIVLAFSLYAIWRTANSAEKAERPWVYAYLNGEFVDGKKGSTTGPFNEYFVQVIVQNSGKLPATNVWCNTSLIAQDKTSQTFAALGPSPRLAPSILAAGESRLIGEYPVVNVGDYFERNDRQYIVSLTYGYSDADGSVIEKGKTIRFGVWPSSVMEDFSYNGDIQIQQYDQEMYEKRMSLIGKKT